MTKEKDWTRVVLYGTFDGFTYSTDGLPKTAVILDGGGKVEVPDEYVLSADKIIREDEIKLKHVLKRIKSFELGTQKVWLDEILHELKSDYGSVKYKDGYEQGKLEGEWVGQQLKDADKIRQELNKPVVPQIVADYIKYTKEADWDLQEAMDDVAYEDNKDLRKWFNDNIETFARAWLDGYTVEKEKRYLVKLKGEVSESFFIYGLVSQKFFFSSDSRKSKCRRATHTRKELEDAGFGDVFDSPLFEVEEVEE